MADSFDSTGLNCTGLDATEFKDKVSEQFREMRENVTHGIEKVNALLDRRLACLEQQISGLQAENQKLREQEVGGQVKKTREDETRGAQKTSMNTWADAAPNADKKGHDRCAVSFAMETQEKEAQHCSEKSDLMCMDQVAEFDDTCSEEEEPSGLAQKADSGMPGVFGSSGSSEESALPPFPLNLNEVPEPQERAPDLRWSPNLKTQDPPLLSSGGPKSGQSHPPTSSDPLPGAFGQSEASNESKPPVNRIESDNRRVSFFQRAGKSNTDADNADRPTVGFVEETTDKGLDLSATGSRSMDMPGRLPINFGRSKTFDTKPDKFDLDKVTQSMSSLKSFATDMPSNFEVLPIWTAKRSQYHRKFSLSSNRASNINMEAVSSPDGVSEVSEDDDTKKRSFLSLWMAHQRCCVWIARHRCWPPNSPVRAVWDAISCFLVFYDMVTIPLELMEPGEFILATLLSWITRIFWTLDIPASFWTGFVNSEGSVECRPFKVLSRYLRTWFLFDLVMVSLEWIELAWGSSGTFGFMRFGRTSRAFRIIRMVRLLRLIRIREVLLVIAERIRSERLIIAADILKIMLVIVSFAHVVGCGWFGIGNGDEGWVKEFNLTDAGLGVRYACSMHWSLTQFSGSMDEFRPVSIAERVYAVVSFLFAFLMASVLVSRLTSSMTRLHMLSNTQAQQLVALRRYLGENGISHRVALRVQKNAQHAILEQQRFMPEHKVELLNLVSEPLRIEVHFELYHQVMSVHPFFSRYALECPHVMRKVCHHAASQSQVSHGDLIFSAGEIPLQPKMFFVTSGTLEYVSMSDMRDAVTPGQWISEMSLWTFWMHRGCLTATSNCRLSVIDAAHFQDIVGLFEHPNSFDPRRYAAHFVSELNKKDEEITDLVIVSFPLSILKRRASKTREIKPEESKRLMNWFLKKGKSSTGLTGKFGMRPNGTNKGSNKPKQLAPVPTDKGNEKDSDSDSDSESD